MELDAAHGSGEDHADGAGEHHHGGDPEACVPEIPARPIDEGDDHAGEEQDQGHVQRPGRAALHAELTPARPAADDPGHLGEPRADVHHEGDEGRGKAELDGSERLRMPKGAKGRR